MNISVKEVQEQLPQLLDRVEQGEQITITRDGKPVARVIAVHPPRDPEVIRQAIEELKRLRKGNRLGELTIRQLIEEGRRY